MKVNFSILEARDAKIEASTTAFPSAITFSLRSSVFSIFYPYFQLETVFNKKSENQDFDTVVTT